jgi:cell division protein FtsZ
MVAQGLDQLARHQFGTARRLDQMHHARAQLLAARGLEQQPRADPRALINVDFADVRTVMSEMGMAMMGSGVASGQDRARIAAEADVSSPLLEDIYLSGANGVLVNVTAGVDLSIGEFQEVGDTIKQFASDDATVVIGTVIDPEMTDEIRVTVVATGLGQAVGMTERPMKVVRRSAPAMHKTREPNYTELEKPAVARKRAVGDGVTGNDSLEDLLDIPAFLRRQAD